MNRFPFSISGVYQGLARTDGIIRFTPDAVTLELETRDSLFGIIRSGPREFTLSARDMESMRLRPGVFRTRLHISAKNLKAVARIPGHVGTELVLTFPRRLTTALRLAVSELSLRISEQEIQEIERG